MSRPVSDLTPEERQQRLAQLRKQRNARLRWWAIRSGIGIGLIGVLVCIGLYWLLQTLAGRDVLLAQIVARLPADAALTWTRAEGPLAGPLTLHGVDLRWQDIHFTAERIRLDPDLRPLLGKRLRLDVLELRNATLELPKSQEPFELPRWPESLPAIQMPLAIQADTLVIDGLSVRQAGEPVITLQRARGGIDIGNGYLRASQLALDTDRGNFRLHGGYWPSNDYLTDLTLSGVFSASPGQAPARLGLVVRGNLDRMTLALAGHAPAPVRLQLTLRGAQNPTWQFSAHSERLDPATLALTTDPLPLALDLKASGTGGQAQLQGRVAQDQTTLVIEPSQIAIADQVLTVQPLVLRALDGLTTLRGRADFSDPANPVFRLAVNAQQLRWGQSADTAITANAHLGVAGQWTRWAAIGQAHFSRAGDRARVDFDARGDDRQAQIKTLRAQMPTGQLDANGQLAWNPALQWAMKATLAGFDPGYFLPDWKGNLSGSFTSQGQMRQSGGVQATLDVPRLSGRLRNRPLEAQGKFALHGDQGEGQLNLSLGGSRVQAKGNIGPRLAVEASLTPLHLADLLPTGSGSVRGTLALSGTPQAPNLQAQLEGSQLRWNDWSADSLSLRGHLPWRGSGGQLALRASTVNVGTVLDHLRLDASGAVEDLRVDGDTRNAMGAIALSGRAQQRNTGWQGALDTLRLAPSKGSAWQLRAPARFAQRGTAWSLSDSCLASQDGGTLCASADWPRQGLKLHSDALPLPLLHPWLPQSGGRALILRGTLALDANVRPRGNAWEGQIRLTSPEGGLKLGNNARGELLSYDHFNFETHFTPQQIQAQLSSGFKGDGQVKATVTTGWDEFSNLRGDLYFDHTKLFWLELFSPDLVRPRGKLGGHIGLAGTRGRPALTGEAQLTEFTGELPALGITLRDGNARLVALADGSARIEGQVASGEGILRVDGSLGWNNDSTPLQFNVRGNNVLVADTPDLRAIASPNLQVGFANNTIQVRGEVSVPSASINVEKLDGGVSASEDVVVLDPIDPERTPSSRLDLDLGITLGQQVALKGYGLEGTLAGHMRVRSRQGREMLATGHLDVEGRYKAYGQKLQITRGQLTWSNNAVSDPRINIRAQREVISAGVTAGIDVTGRAGQPRAKVWSEPASSESEALAYLVLGRSLNSASSDESQRINAASSALSAGAGLLASQLGAKIGLDDAGVLESRTLGGSVFGVGKYLSPRLYVSYGVSMVGSGSAVTLKYLLRKGFDVEIESSTIESRGSINWRKEK